MTDYARGFLFGVILVAAPVMTIAMFNTEYPDNRGTWILQRIAGQDCVVLYGMGRDKQKEVTRVCDMDVQR